MGSSYSNDNYSWEERYRLNEMERRMGDLEREQENERLQDLLKPYP